MRKFVVVAVCGLALAGCRNAESSENRGYTKAPLEDPGFTIEAEEPTKMTELGAAPKRPRPEEIELKADSARAGS